MKLYGGREKNRKIKIKNTRKIILGKYISQDNFNQKRIIYFNIIKIGKMKKRNIKLGYFTRNEMSRVNFEQNHQN